MELVHPLLQPPEYYIRSILGPGRNRRIDSTRFHSVIHTLTLPSQHKLPGPDQRATRFGILEGIGVQGIQPSGRQIVERGGRDPPTRSGLRDTVFEAEVLMPAKSAGQCCTGLSPYASQGRLSGPKIRLRDFNINPIE